MDTEGNNLPAGQTGEIAVRGPSITLGYLDEPEATRRVFKDGWLHTGDLGHLDEDGYIWIEGRKSAFLKVRGVRVNFAEVEARVAAVPGVYECAAAAIAHPEAGEALVLYIVPDKTADRVADRVRRSLPGSLDLRLDQDRFRTSENLAAAKCLARPWSGRATGRHECTGSEDRRVAGRPAVWPCSAGQRARIPCLAKRRVGLCL